MLTRNPVWTVRSRPNACLERFVVQLFSFQVRAPLRDKNVDDARIALITSAIQSALTGARKEQDGLRRRLNDARAQAAFFFEAEDDEYSNRSESMERHLREIESRLTAAEQRLKQLDEHLMKLHELDSVLKRSFPAG